MRFKKILQKYVWNRASCVCEHHNYSQSDISVRRPWLVKLTLLPNDSRYDDLILNMLDFVKYN